MKKNKYPLDSDNAEQVDRIESALLEGLYPLSPDIKQRSKIQKQLFSRIRSSNEAESNRITIRNKQGNWRNILPGVRAKTLDKIKRAFILDIASGASLPMHRHHEDEECIVLHGTASLGDLEVQTGDYHLARAGSRHGRIHSETGARIYLRGTPIGHNNEIARDLVTALLPGNNNEWTTIRADEGNWSELSCGVSSKPLFSNYKSYSSLIRIAEETHWNLSSQKVPQDEEYLILEGEAFFGDTLLQAGDWQFVQSGSIYRPIATDEGVLLFRRGANDKVFST